MDISQDLQICEGIISEYKKMTPEDGQGAYKLSLVALSMFDRLNNLRFQANIIKFNEKSTKSDVKEYLRAKMKVMEHIHIQSRAIYAAIERDKNFKRV